MTMPRSLTAILVSACLAALPALSHADDVDTAIKTLARDWSHVTYEVPKAQQDDAYTALETQGSALIAQYPRRAEPRVWQAIILSTHAGEHGGLGALGMAKRARDLLQEAQKIQPDVLNGSIYTTLGSLYYQVPGWPLGFGDKDKARSLLEKALQVDPDGIDPNYFYADFLYRTGDKAGAMAHLRKALAASPRSDQPLADKGRRAQAQKLIDTLSADK
ncbi:tetratricopeptide repeat protein [Luteibacter aegosomatis]|uniref:tetratricopeptide repeat protein n=1 Tax=Luteibacter aegosomatis TaxID=2911537 RepID=UPI001FFA7390|nr:tetratricopeptide repeat protein [Luteibacter aegosomatis]UPG83868.1 tetratricopeptide repeat protein [Luteibacter aegosomatis]